LCNQACIDFGRDSLKEEDVRGKSVIEVGSLNVNGSLRPIVEALHPASYVGVDIRMGPGVDQICNVLGLLDHFGYEKFDLLISTEMLEHVKDWQKAISNLKNVLKPDGVLLITTRSKGFRYHEFPYDFWRYEKSDMKAIFSDFIIEVIKKDHLRPGIFVKAKKPPHYIEKDLTDYKLYSVIKRKRTPSVIDDDIRLFEKQYGKNKNVSP
jgi:SAM-dependent methyltransferase